MLNEKNICEKAAIHTAELPGPNKALKFGVKYCVMPVIAPSRVTALINNTIKRIMGKGTVIMTILLTLLTPFHTLK